MEAMVDTDSDTEATAMAVLATAMARGLLTPRLMPTMATEAMVDMVLATPLATVLATAMLATARGLLTPRLMPTMATEAMVDMVLATPLATVLATAMVVMARGQLTLRPMPTMAMVDTDSVMADTAMVVLATAMARGLLMPSLLWIRWSLHRLRIWWIRTWSWLWLRQGNNGSYPEVPRLMQGTATTNICHILNFKLEILELCLLKCTLCLATRKGVRDMEPIIHN